VTLEEEEAGFCLEEEGRKKGGGLGCLQLPSFLLGAAIACHFFTSASLCYVCNILCLPTI